MSDRTSLSLTLLAALLAPDAAASGVWGSLDSSRLESPGDALATSSTMSDLRSEIVAAGGSLATPASTIDATYLGGVDVFFTSMMSAAPSSTELTALSDFVQNGGVCIVTCDDGNRAASSAVFNQLGFDVHAAGGAGDGFGFGGHGLVTDVETISYTDNASLGTSDATVTWLLGNDDEEVFAMVNEQTLGSGMGLGLAAPDAWYDGAAGDADTWRENVVAWAHGDLACGTSASSANYGAGHAGTAGVPALTLVSPPQIGTEIAVTIGNSAGVDALTVLLIGIAPAFDATSLGGTLLVTPSTSVSFTTPAAGVTLPATIPSDATLCGVTTFVQTLQQDAGASHGASFSRGLAVTIGT